LQPGGSSFYSRAVCPHFMTIFLLTIHHHP
jgi:hypothetical protein